MVGETRRGLRRRKRSSRRREREGGTDGRRDGEGGRDENILFGIIYCHSLLTLAGYIITSL